MSQRFIYWTSRLGSNCLIGPLTHNYNNNNNTELILRKNNITLSCSGSQALLHVCVTLPFLRYTLTADVSTKR